MVTQKYVKALLSVLSEEEIKNILEALKILSTVAKDEKFILIVKSPSVSIEEKVSFIKDLTKCENNKFLNFVKILLENKRIDLIKDIYKAFYSEYSKKFNKYEGFVEARIDENTLKSIEEKLSKEFNATINLKLKEKDLNGIRVFVDVLNIEVAILEDKIKSDLLNKILKAI